MARPAAGGRVAGGGGRGELREACAAGEASCGRRMARPAVEAARRMARPAAACAGGAWGSCRGGGLRAPKRPETSIEAGAASSGGRDAGNQEVTEPVKKDKVERERKEKNRKKMEKRRR